MGMFDDLVPTGPGGKLVGGGVTSAGMFDDLLPQAPAGPQAPSWAKQWVSAYGGDPNRPMKTDAQIGREFDDFGRSVASGMTFNLADEIVAGGRAALSDKTYDETLAEERARDKEIPAGIAIPGQIIGGVATGAGLARSGATLLNAAKPTVGNMAARGAGEGAAYGAAHGFGAGEGEEDRLARAAEGGVIGAVTGGATGAFAGKMAQRDAAKEARKTIPTTDDLKAQSQGAYASAKQQGLAVQPDSFGGMVGRAAGRLKVEEGLDPTLHPNTTRALERLAETKDAPMSLQEVETLRKVVNAAWKNSKPGSDDARLARQVIDDLDDYMDNLSLKDVAAGDPLKAVSVLKDARKLWAQARKSETVDDLMQRAEDRVQANYSTAGLDTAIRQEFKSLLLDKKRLRGFSEEEVDAIRRVARGGPVQTALRYLGKWSPNGVISTAGGAYLGSVLGGPLGAAGMAAVPALGAAARQGATAMTKGNVGNLSDIVRSGGSLPEAVPLPLTPQMQQLYQGLIVGEGQQLPGLLGLRQRGLLSSGQ